MRLYSFDEADRLDFSEIQDLYKRYSNARLPDLYSRFSFGTMIFERAEGAYLYSRDGRQIFDFTGGLGVANMGHNHPRILSVRQRFAAEKRTEIHKNYLNRFLAAASANLAAILPGDLNYSYFCNSGAEAVDGALKISYRYHMGARPYVLRSDRSFHGKTIGAGSLSFGDNFISGPARFSFQKMPGVHTYNFNDVDSVQELVRQNDRKFYAIFVEPFSCSTLVESSAEFLRAIRKICDEQDILLVFDEIYSGFAKCGPNFYMEKYGIVPDVVCLSKALGAGKASISAYVARDKVFHKAYGSLAGALMHSTTYNSFAEECATALEAIQILVDERLSERSLAIEEVMRQKLTALAKRSSKQLGGECRGAGTHWGMVFDPPFAMLQPVLSMVPVSFFQDPQFLRKLAATAVAEEYFASADALCAFTANQNVILNFSPAPVSEPDEITAKLDAFEAVLDKGVIKCVLEFVAKNFREGGR